MPLYDYKCTNGHIFEVLQSWSADPIATCGECGSASKRQMAVPMVLYKGSGFYTTDYGRNSSSSVGRNGESDSKSNGDSKSSSEKSSSTSKAGKSEKSSKSPAKSD